MPKKKIRTAVIVLATALSLFIAIDFLMPNFKRISSLLEILSTEPTEDLITQDAKIDKRGDRIDALEDYEEGETWAIYVYMVGSDLERGNMNSLSDLTNLIVTDVRKEIQREKRSNKIALIAAFEKELLENDMSLPELFYLPTTPSVKTSQASQATIYEYAGSAMYNINMMREVELPEGVQIIIQTGGANAWSDVSINPNRSERFLYDKDGFRKIESNPLVNMGKPESLSDFLTFCEENYDADHKMVLFWNHGGGYVGYGVDEIFDDMLTLSELKKAFSDVYGDNPETPPFDIIGFDACLMAALEVVNTLYPYSDYLIASEEVEPGAGWDYEAFLGAFEGGSNVHAEKLAKAAIDGFAEFYAKTNIETQYLSYIFETTLSLIDMRQGKALYDAYSSFAEAALKAAANDLSTLSDISRAGTASMIFFEGRFDFYNILDLKSFMENVSEYYPKESEAVLNQLEKTVLYARGTSYGANAGGITISYPLYVTNINGLYNAIDYITNIADDDAIKALYYYKIAGCLNEEHAEYLRTLGIDNPQKLDSSTLNNLINTEPEIDGNTVRIPLSDEQYDLLQNASMALTRIDGDTITYLGEKGNIELKEDRIEAEIDGKWISINGKAFAIDRISDLGDTVKYRSKVLHNGNESYLIFSYDKLDDSVAILGVVSLRQGDSEFLAAERTIPLERGDVIAPLYTVSEVNDTGIENEIIAGDAITIRGKERVSYSALSDGEYVLSLSAFDFRGDEYFSPTLSFNVKDGIVEDLAQDDSFTVVLID